MVIATSPATRFLIVNVSVSLHSPGFTKVSVRDVDGTNYSWTRTPRGARIVSGSQAESDLAALQAIHASSEGIRDGDGNRLTIGLRGVHADFISSIDDLEPNGLPNLLIAGSYERWENLQQVRGALLQHASVEVHADTGRRDIEIGGGFIPTKRVSNSGEVQQPLEDWTASNVVGKLRITIYSRTGENWDEASLISDDPRLEAMIRFLDTNRTSGSPINFGGGITLSSLHTALVARTYTVDQNIGSETHNIALDLSSSNRSYDALNLTFNITSGTLNVSLMNAMLSGTSFGLETDDAIEEPPFGNTAVRLRTERVEFANGQFISERGIPTWRFAGRSHPMGGSYGGTIRLHNLILHDDGYHYFPWEDREAVYDLRAVHIEDFFDVVVRLGSYDEMAVGSGSQFSFDIHNANDHGGATVRIDDADGNDIITLLPQETFSVVTEQFTNGNGEIRSGRNIPRPLEVSADDNYAVLGDVGYWEDSSSHWARPVPFPAESERATDLFYAEDVFEFGTASISNGTSRTASSFNLHVKEAFKLLKADGRFRYRMTALARAKPSTSGSVFPNLRLWRQRGGVGNAPVVLLTVPHALLESNDEQVWELVFEDEGGHVAVGDVFCPVVVTNKNSSRNPSNIELVAFRLSVYLDEEIVLEYFA